MSQTAKPKVAKKKKNKSTKPEPVQEPEELTGAEKLLEDIKPYLTTIMLCVVAVVLGFIAIAFWNQTMFQSSAASWRDLSNYSSIAIRTGEVAGLEQVAVDHADTKAGSWAMQLAGDQQLRAGLEQLAYNREDGLGLIRKSKANFKGVFEAKDAAKTEMLKRRSNFSLAYACESLGEFPEAKALYQQLVDEAPDSAFANAARRGIKRTSNDDFAALYDKFKSWEEEEIGEAPGPTVPKRPDISFDGIDVPEGEKPPAGGDFEPGEKPEASAPEKTEPAKTDADPESDAAPKTEDGKMKTDGVEAKSEEEK